MPDQSIFLDICGIFAVFDKVDTQASASANNCMLSFFGQGWGWGWGVMLGPYCRLKTTPAGNCQKLDVKEYTSVIKDGQG